MMPNYRHFCPEWDFLEIDADSPEWEACLCNIDSDGRGPKFHHGDRVRVLPLNVEATVIRQNRSFDGSESFWGDVRVLYADGVQGISNSWQLEKL